jgi:hypothetical protein
LKKKIAILKEGLPTDEEVQSWRTMAASSNNSDSIDFLKSEILKIGVIPGIDGGLSIGEIEESFSAR